MNNVYLNICFLLIGIKLTETLFIPRPLPVDARLNFTELGIKYGHNVEEHDVITEDGYVLTLFHIPSNKRPSVFLMHGILDSADTFIIRGNISLVISLANAGYDIWAGNSRGNKYGRRHIKLNPDSDEEFWNYSFHECGVYDLAANIDYVLNKTGEKSLQTIGHSQGTSMHFVLGSTRPEYNEKIKIHVALAPVAYLANTVPPVSSLIQLTPVINEVLTAIKIEEIFGDKSLPKALTELICNQGSISYDLCVLTSIFSFSGADMKSFEPEFLPVLIGHYPAATSKKSILHYAQLGLSRRFANFDYGSLENMKRYGYLVPADYNLQNVTMKTALLCARNDGLSRLKDVEYLRMQLPNIVEYHVMKSKLWNHLDYVWGNQIVGSLVPIISQFLEKYN